MACLLVPFFSPNLPFSQVSYTHDCISTDLTTLKVNRQTLLPTNYMAVQKKKKKKEQISLCL